jgi:uncharacterized protein (DUF1330 family)
MSAYLVVEFTVNSPEYQHLTDVRSAAMDARFSLLDGLPS